MRLSSIAVSLLISQVTASVLNDAARLVGRDGGLERRMRRYVDSMVDPEPVERRQAPPRFNVTQWDENTIAACQRTLVSLNGVASNPSGMAVCYNLPFWDNSTGVFRADLRLFAISAPTGAFANIASENVQVGLSYIGATVSAVNASTLGRRAKVSSGSWASSEEGLERRQTVVPIMVQSYAFVGQINADLLTANMGTSDVQKVLVPTVSLTGTDATGNSVNTSLSSQEAAFVTGVFATIAVPTKSQVEPPIQTLVVESGAAFVVPGVQILIFPIGGVITGVWAILFVATIAYGTYGRMQFRESYRRRSARANKGEMARI